MGECAHEWSIYDPGLKPGIEPIWAGLAEIADAVKIHVIKECMLCNRLVFELDYVPETPFLFYAYSRVGDPRPNTEP